MAADPEDVDDQGNPETPTKVALEKKKKKNLTYFGLALGALGVVVAVVVARRNAATGTTGTSANLPLTTGQVAGAGSGAPMDSSGSSSSDAQYQALAQQLSDFEGSSQAAQAGFVASLDHLTSVLNSTHGPATAPAAGTLPALNPANFPRTIAANEIEKIGSDPTANHYSGFQLKGGAPLYAFIKGVWTQGVNPNSAPAGTVFGTPISLDKYVNRPTSSAAHLPQPVAAVTGPVPTPATRK